MRPRLSYRSKNCALRPEIVYGSAEWLRLPRPDSRSVFGALLDRTAGLFRVGTSKTHVPRQGRYVPGTMVLETTWHTPTGWLVVQDLLALGPTQVNGRRKRYRRAPSDAVATGTLLRIATCISGRVEVLANCVPLFNYGVAGGASGGRKAANALVSASTACAPKNWTRERFKYAANLAGLMWILLVCGLSFRPLMSPIMRWRSGLMASVLMGNSPE